MALGTLLDNQKNSFVESPARQGGAAVEVVSVNQPLIVRSASSGGYVYTGIAVSGSSESSPLWRVLRETTVSGALNYADLGSYTNIWDNRLSLTYS